MSEKYTTASVDLIYDGAKKLGYNKGFIAGYKKGLQDAKEILEKLGASDSAN